MNAVRCLGHLSALLFRRDFAQVLESCAWDWVSFVRQVIKKLSYKVEGVLTAIQGRRKSSLSWKHRSALKKHGRVASNSLTLVFKQLSSLDSLANETAGACLIAIKSLTVCIECLGSQLDSKVLVAAMSSFLALDSTLLSAVSGRSGTVGHALVSCILFLAPVSNILLSFLYQFDICLLIFVNALTQNWEKSTRCSNDKVFLQTETLLKHLLDSASIQDAIVVLSCDEIADGWTDALYQWMVSKGCSPKAFDNFALAMQKSGLNVPTSVEQKFSNRAMNILRHDSEIDNYGDDDEL